MGKQLLLNDVVAKANIKHNFRYDYSKSIYLGSKKKFEIICPDHGSFWQTPDAHIGQGQGCKLCISFQYTNKSMDLFLKENNILIQRIDNCFNSKDKIKWRCMVELCQYEWCASSEKIVLRRQGCPNCAGNAPLTDNIIDKRLILLKLSISRVTSCKEGAMKNINWRCENKGCNHIWSATPNNILNHNRGCPECNGIFRLTNEIIDQRLKFDERPIKRIGNYIDIREPIDFKCLNESCRNIWISAPDNILNSGSGCPDCSRSRNEKLVEKILLECKIIYEKQKNIMKIINIEKRKILVDFYIPDKKIIIEYNGRQHYQPVCFGGISIERAKLNFIKQCERDLYLKLFCDQNNITLIQIDGREYINFKLKIYLLNEIIPKLKDNNEK